MNLYLDKVRPYQAVSHDIWNFDVTELQMCLKLDWNEATIPPSPKVRDRILELASDPYFYQWYPNTNNEKLLEAIGNYVGVGKENVQVFSSSDILHEYAVKIWLSMGDKAVLMWPTYDNFRATVESIGVEVIYYEMDDFVFDAEKLDDFIVKYEPKLVYICNPNNPSGQSIDINSLKQLLGVHSDCMFLVDEAYIEYSGNSMSHEAVKIDNLLISRTFSKAFGLANFRIGYLISSAHNIEAISKIRNAKSISTFAQEAAMAALEDLPYMQGYVKEVIKSREMFIEEINKMHVGIYAYPSEANFVLLSFESKELKDKFFFYLKQKNIFIRMLNQSISLNNYLRITIGTMTQMRFVIERIKQFVRDYENCTF